MLGNVSKDAVGCPGHGEINRGEMRSGNRLDGDGAKRWFAATRKIVCERYAGTKTKSTHRRLMGRTRSRVVSVDAKGRPGHGEISRKGMRHLYRP